MGDEGDSAGLVPTFVNSLTVNDLDAFGQVSTTTAVEKGRSSQRSLLAVREEDYKLLNTKRLHELHNFLFNQEPATNILRLQPVFHRLFHRLFLVFCGESTC